MLVPPRYLKVTSDQMKSMSLMVAEMIDVPTIIDVPYLF